jgi:hypothetical protein
MSFMHIPLRQAGLAERRRSTKKSSVSEQLRSDHRWAGGVCRRLDGIPVWAARPCLKPVEALGCKQGKQAACVQRGAGARPRIKEPPHGVTTPAGSPRRRASDRAWTHHGVARAGQMNDWQVIVATRAGCRPALESSVPTVSPRHEKTRRIPTLGRASAIAGERVGPLPVRAMPQHQQRERDLDPLTRAKLDVPVAICDGDHRGRRRNDASVAQGGGNLEGFTGTWKECLLERAGHIGFWPAPPSPW